MARTTYDPATALLVVDVQNDFADPEGSLAVEGGADIVDGLNDEIAAALAADATVVYTQDWHPPSTPHFEKDGGVWPVHCVRDTWGAELHPGLRIEGEVVRKGVDGGDGYSGFMVRDPRTGDEHPTELDGMLRAREVGRVVVTGIATDVCVRATALDALRLGYETEVLEQLVRAVDLQPGDGRAALDELAEQGASVIA